MKQLSVTSYTLPLCKKKTQWREWWHRIPISQWGNTTGHYKTTIHCCDQWHVHTFHYSPHWDTFRKTQKNTPTDVSKGVWVFLDWKSLMSCDRGAGITITACNWLRHLSVKSTQPQTHCPTIPEFNLNKTRLKKKKKTRKMKCITENVERFLFCLRVKHFNLSELTLGNMVENTIII